MNLMLLASFLSMMPMNSVPAQFEITLNVVPGEMPTARAMAENAINALSQQAPIAEVTVDANYTENTIYIRVVPHLGPQQLTLTTVDGEQQAVPVDPA